MNPVWGCSIIDDVHHCDTLHFITARPYILSICVGLLSTSADDEDAFILQYKTKVTVSNSKLVSFLESLLFKVKDDTSEIVDEYNKFVPHHSSQQTLWLRQMLSEYSAEFCSRVKLLDKVKIPIVLSHSSKHVNKRLVDGTGCIACIKHQLSNFCPLVGQCVVQLNAVQWHFVIVIKAAEYVHWRVVDKCRTMLTSTSNHVGASHPAKCRLPFPRLITTFSNTSNIKLITRHTSCCLHLHTARRYPVRLLYVLFFEDWHDTRPTLERVRRPVLQWRHTAQSQLRLCERCSVH